MYRVLILRIIAGLAGGIIAHKKGRGKFLWAVLCFILPPLVLVLLLLRPREAKGINKRCPYCANVIPKDEAICRYCQKELPIEMVQCKNCGSFVPDKGYCVQCNRKRGD